MPYLGHVFPILFDILKQRPLVCTYNIQLDFNRKPYKQIDGVSMASLLGPHLTDIFIAKIEQRSQKITKLPFHRRYVDDIFLYSNLLLTSEQSLFNFISLLDIPIIKQENVCNKFSIYRRFTARC